MSDKLGKDSPAVQVHLGTLQSVISRMAGNSTSSKTWCITLVSAILVIVADKSKPEYAWIAVLPTLLFAILDAYYLALEKGFRQSYKEFVASLNQNAVKPEDLYAVEPKGSFLGHLFKAVRSFSVWPFYLMLLIMVCIAKTVIL